MNHDWVFLPMRPSNELLGDPTALRERLAQDSYLYFRGVLDPEKIMALRRAILGVLVERGWIRGGLSVMEAKAVCRPLHEGLEGYAPVYDAVQRIEEFHTLAHDVHLTAIMADVVGETAFPHPLKIGRLAFPEHYEATTPPHQDFPNNQGTPDLTASWIPVGDISRDLGGLAILRGSHQYGLLPLAGHMGPGQRQAVVPQRMLEELRWVTTDYQAGDVVLFPSLTVHASLHNITEFDMRLSVDFRYQQERQPLTPVCLEPHFQRQSWDDVYRDWSSDQYQYYWKELDYDVVEFEDFPIVGTDDDADRNEGFTEDEWHEILMVDKRWEARYQRRIERLAESLGEPISAARSDA